MFVVRDRFVLQEPAVLQGDHVSKWFLLHEIGSFSRLLIISANALIFNAMHSSPRSSSMAIQHGQLLVQERRNENGFRNDLGFLFFSNL